VHSDDDLLQLSALQHWLFCPRQAALIHLEQLWADNRFTAEGDLIHEKAHEGADESRPGVRITRGMPVVSRRLGISGRCDIVEFHADGTVVPVEYKRGSPKSHDADRAQLCCQAMCLEEMLGISIASGWLFYDKRKRRTLVKFDAALREVVESAATALHGMIAAQITPMARYDSGRCDSCSLLDTCQPKALRLKRGASSWFDAALSGDDTGSSEDHEHRSMSSRQP
jgi:CRISPR-associated exonuclease Cas4